MSTTPKKFSIQQVFEILLRDSDKKIIAYLEDAKTSSLENTVEMVYPTGGRGNVYIGGGFAHSRRAKLNVTNATWNTEVMAAQNGTELVTAGSGSKVKITKYEVITASTAGASLSIAKSAEGLSGSEILYAYKLAEDGTPATVYTQSTTATSTTFSYSNKSLTFSSGTISKGDTFAVAYQYEDTDGAQELSVKADGLPKTALVTAYGMAKDICTGDLYPCQVDGMVQIDGNYTFELTADGEPSIQSLNLEFVRGCGTKKLYDFKVYTE